MLSPLGYCSYCNPCESGLKYLSMSSSDRKISVGEKERKNVAVDVSKLGPTARKIMLAQPLNPIQSIKIEIRPRGPLFNV